MQTWAVESGFFGDQSVYYAQMSLKLQSLQPDLKFPFQTQILLALLEVARSLSSWSRQIIFLMRAARSSHKISWSRKSSKDFGYFIRWKRVILLLKIALGFIGKHNFPWLKMFLRSREWQILSAKFMVDLYQAKILSNWPRLSNHSVGLQSKHAIDYWVANHWTDFDIQYDCTIKTWMETQPLVMF